MSDEVHEVDFFPGQWPPCPRTCPDASPDGGGDIYHKWNKEPQDAIWYKPDWPMVIGKNMCTKNHFRKREDHCRVSVSLDAPFPSTEWKPDERLQFTLNIPSSSYVNKEDYDCTVYVQMESSGVLTGCAGDPMDKDDPAILFRPDVYWPSTDELIQNSHMFDLMLVHDERILRECPENAKFFNLFLHGVGWPTPMSLVKNNIGVERKNKTNQISFLTSDKAFLSGHVLRQHIYEFLLKDQKKQIGQYEILAIRTPPVIPKKDVIFENAKFSIVVENTQEPNWVTEKLMDCMLTKTVPIYWGAPNVGEFFNADGIIQFNTQHELENILNRICNELGTDYYDNMMPYIEENYNRALDYVKTDFYETIDNEIDEFLKKDEKKKDANNMNTHDDTQILWDGKDLYGTMLPALKRAIEHFRGPSLEFGCGNYSTRLLCSQLKGIELHSFEDEKSWHDVIEEKNHHIVETHHLHYVDDWENSFIYKDPEFASRDDWSIIFVDHGGGRAPGEYTRLIEIQNFIDKCDVMLIHDFDGDYYGGDFRYHQIAPLFLGKSMVEFPSSVPNGPATVAVSGRIDLSQFDWGNLEGNNGEMTL